MRHLQGRALLLALLLLLPPEPADAWYKHAATPRFHAVGRAAGLLLGLRRAPSVWRRALSPAGAVELGPRAGDTVAAGAGARGERALPLGMQELRWGSVPGLPVGAVRRPRVPEPSADTASWT